MALSDRSGRVPAAAVLRVRTRGRPPKSAGPAKPTTPARPAASALAPSSRSRGLRALRRTVRRRPDTAPRHRPLLVVLVLHVVVLGLLLLGGCTAMPAGVAMLYLRAQGWMSEHTIELPRSGPLDRDLPQTARITSRDGTVLAEIDDVRYGHRTFVPLHEMSQDLVNATLVTEDRRFHEHPGVDAIGLLRAITSNAEAGGVSQGGSTIEMQLTRNLYLPGERGERSLARKLKEALAAFELDKRYSKDDILEAYLNIVFYGNRAFGVEAAAQVYFGKSVRDLSLPEATLLAGLPQSPSRYDPLAHLEAAKGRQRAVLGRMVDANLLTADEAYAALAAPLKFREVTAQTPARAQHFTNYVRELVRARFGPEQLFTGGLSIRTTIDLEVQQLAEQTVARNEGIRQTARANNTAVVVIEPATSQVLAMVGSKDFDDVSIAGQFNVATSVRQPGSSIKPLVFLAGFEHGLTPATLVLDEPTAFSAPLGQPPYRPENYEKKYYGRIGLREALGNSLNVPSVKVLKYVGVPAFQELARRLGITTLDRWDPRWLSLTLGGGEVRLLELTGAYATLAREGSR
jgi:membrane peptidoglycan carboxypeptidase